MMQLVVQKELHKAVQAIYVKEGNTRMILHN